MQQKRKETELSRPIFSRPTALAVKTALALLLFCSCQGAVEGESTIGSGDPAHLLKDSGALDSPKALALLPSRTSTVYRAEKGEWQFNLHSYVTWFDGKFWAVWSSGRVDEDSGRQLLRYATSSDGHTWSESKILVDDPDGDQGPALWIARGVYVQDGKLLALGAYLEGARDTPEGRESWQNLKLIQFEWDGNGWQNRGTLVENCMNNYPPRRAGDHLFMTCRDSRTRMHTAVSDASGKRWSVTPMPMKDPSVRISEPSWYEDPNGKLHLIFRDSSQSKFVYRSISDDKGITWSAPVRTNYPDATSKNIAGRLADGRYYLINNPAASKREVLAISFSEDGWQFSEARALRNEPPPRRYPGHAKGSNSFQYPHVVERGNSLFVIYSTNKEDIEISEFHIADFPRPQSSASGVTSAKAEGKDPALLGDPKEQWYLPQQFPVAKAKHSTVFKGVKGESGFNLHSYLAYFDNRFWAIWSSSKEDEEDPDQHLRYATSQDGHTWTASQVLAADPDGDNGPLRWIARGIWVENGQLQALGARISSADYGKRGKEVVWKDLDLYRFAWNGTSWEDKGIFAKACMNNFPPSRLGENYAMVCRDENMNLFMAIRDASISDGWKRVALTAAPPFDRMDEPTWYQDHDGVIHMLIRDNTKSKRILRAISHDGGATWSKPVYTNYPDATSKHFDGLLSNGRYFLVNNPNPDARYPLAVSVSDDGWVFRDPKIVRDAPPETYRARLGGRTGFQYPHALEHNGSLWVIYSTNKADIEVTEVPLSELGAAR